MSLHLQKFNERVKAMNQMRSRDITITAEDARNLQADIFTLLGQISRLEDALSKASAPIEDRLEIRLDGGGFGPG